MKIAIAQTRPIKGDFIANIESHKKLILMAVSRQVDAVFFPELSMMGYEPELAKDLAIDVSDERFEVFQQISNAHFIVIGIGVPLKSEEGILKPPNPQRGNKLGVPIKSEEGVLIGMMIFQPNKPREHYAKQQLHSDEFPYFVSGKHQTILTINQTKIALAICYESLQENHAEIAHHLGAKIYVASVAKSQNGIDKANLHYPYIAKKYGMTVLMANCVGVCDNFESVGNSAIWNDEGILIKQLGNENEDILVFDTETP